MAAAADAQPQLDAKTLRTGAVKPEESPKPLARGKSNATSDYTKESQATALALAKSKAKRRP